VQLIDLETHYSQPDGTLIRNKKKVDRGEQCYFASPMDFPAYVRFTRTVDNTKEGTNTSIDVLSVTAEIDLYPAGVRIFIKWDRKKKQYVLMKQVGTDKATVIERFS